MVRTTEMIPRLLISVLVAFCLYQLCLAHCDISSYTCKNERCVNRLHVCDGDDDCNDNSDETICVPETCNNPALFKCKDGLSCISVLKVCDGNSNCGDSSDETECGSEPCNHPALFKCDDGLCIADRFLCDGTPNCYDDSDEGMCGLGVLMIGGVNTSRSKGISWLKSKRNDRWGWEENTPRAIVGLYLSGNVTFDRTIEQEEELMVKQLELKIALSLLRNETTPLSPIQLAVYINALLVSCHNPRNFYGRDLVNVLKLMVESRENQTHPVVYLALCNANETASINGVRYLLALLDHKSEYLFWTDFQAVALIALSCVTRQSQHAHLAPNVTAAVNSFKLRQKDDGSFGNIYTSALVVQALLATGNEMTKDWDLRGAIQFFLFKQSTSDSSFGDFLATYLVLPILGRKSLADIAHVKCTNLRRQPRDRNLVLDFSSHLGPLVYVMYSLYIGDDMKVIYPISLKVPANITVYDVMNLATRADSRYKYESRRSSRGLYVYSIARTANDAETGMFWMLYLGLIDNKEGALKRESPDKIFIKGGEHIIMWYRTASSHL